MFLIILLGIIVGSHTLSHELRLFSGMYGSGSETTITTKIPNFSGNNSYFDQVLKTAKSVCYFGNWDFYDAENYTAFTIRLGWTKEPICINIQTMHNVNFLRATKSLRYHGPANTTMSSLTITGDSGFYPGRNVTGHWIGGKEMIYVAQKVNDIPFSPSYIVLTGNHTWTGFSNNDLTGNSICYIPDGEFAIHNYLLESPMLSFAKGCDANVRRIKVLRVQLDPIAELYMSYCGKYNARFNLN